MKAIVATKYGSPEVFQLKEIAKPTPKANEVLVRIHASSVTAADTMMRRGTPFYGRLFIGLLKPNNPIPGTGFAGVVEAVGTDVTHFTEGDAVFGESIFGAGTNAEYVCVAENGIIISKPANISFAEAASICDGPLTSLNFLKNLASIQPGQKVLVNGASGSLGTAAIQLAKYFEAKVTGVCSTNNVELVKSLGADHVIDYTQEDFTKSNTRYDVIYDTVGKSSYSQAKKVLTANGAYISPVLNMTLLLQMMCTSLVGKKKAKFSATGILPLPALRDFLYEIRAMICAGYLKSIVDKEFSLEQIAEAHAYVDNGHKRGNVVLSMNESI
ncbi:MAG: NAD(P)-dependent alcohol dehydrogenase [Cyclobacteriaceae bacterium]